MSCWEVLGIEPTDNLCDIKSAFAERSKSCHPEDNPEGFRRLRDAYRQAAALSQHRKEAATHSFEAVNSETAAPDSQSNIKPTYILPLQTDPDIIHTPDKHLDFTEAERQYKGREKAGQPPDASVPVSPPPQAAAVWQAAAPQQSSESVSGTRTHKVSPYIIMFAFIMLCRGIAYLSNTSNYSTATTENFKIEKRLISEWDGTVTSTDLETLEAQALELWHYQAADRLETLDQLKAGTPYPQCLAASRLRMSENDYNLLRLSLNKDGESVTAEKLEQYRTAEELFVRTRILPPLKLMITQQYALSHAEEICSLLNLPYGKFIEINGNYLKDESIEKLESALLKYNRLAPPELWKTG
jgi:hypothetical protein